MIKGKKVAGIVCEYNPFHNGHKYHIEKTKEITGCEYIICAMSGSVVQRGDIAICDKWQRASIAVDNGADLVIEIPSYYVLQSAQNYAYGSVSLLDALGVADCLSFGSESGDKNLLCTVADMLTHEPEEYSSLIKDAMDKGMSYPAACEHALTAYMKTDFNFTPNDILAVNYIKAINRIKSNMIPTVIHRTNDYHATETTSDMASATAVRNMIGLGEDVSGYVPILPGDIYNISNIGSLILGFFRTVDAKSLDDIIGMEDGLANRLITCAKKCTCYRDFVDACISKRYTRHRIQRVIMCCLLSIRHERIMDYVRVLAMNDKGRELLSEIKKSCTLTIVTKTSDFAPSDNSMFQYDILSTDLAALCCTDESKRIGSKDYTTSPYVR